MSFSSAYLCEYKSSVLCWVYNRYLICGSFINCLMMTAEINMKIPAVTHDGNSF